MKLKFIKMRTLALVFVLLVFQFSVAQTTCFDTILSGYNVSSVTDDDQFIWAGTSNNGLVSFNKTTNVVQIYNISNSNISSNLIKSVLYHNNQLYVSSDSSLMTFSNGGFQEISNTFQGIMSATPNGNLAIAAPYDFNILNTDNNVIYTKDLLSLLEQSCCGSSTDMEYDENGVLWISNYGFYEYDILSYDGTSWSIHDVNNSILPEESFYSYNGLTIYNGEVWVSNNGNVLHKYENSIWSLEHSLNTPSVLNEEDNIDDMVINAIRFDSDGSLWVGAGDYENNESGKIAFKSQNDWVFIDSGMLELPGVNNFKASQVDSNIMYAATNDGVLVFDKNCLVLSVPEIETVSNGILVYPNPTNAVLNLNVKEGVNVSYNITNILGQNIISKTNIKNRIIDMSQYSNGIYNIVFVIDNNIIVKKIVKIN